MRIVHVTDSVHMLHLMSLRMYGCLLKSGRIVKCAGEQNRVYGVNIKIITVSETYKVSVDVCFVPEGQITKPPIDVVDQVCQVGTERKEPLLFSGIIHNDCCDQYLLNYFGAWCDVLKLCPP